VYDDLPPPDRPMTDYEHSIHRQCLAGLPDDQDRLAESARILHYYEMGEPFVRREAGDTDGYPIENSGLTRRVVQIRNSLIYSPPPSRGITDDAASNEFLAEVYEDTLVNDLMAGASELADLLGVAAVGVLPGRGLKPICLYLLDATQFVVKADEDDAATPAHLIAIDQTGDGRMRYTWWSADARRVYIAKGNGSRGTAGGRTTELVAETINPYGRIPFALVHSELPFRGMTSPGIGEWLSNAQEKIDSLRYKLSLGFTKYALPKPYVKGVNPNWSPSDVIGEYMRIPTGAYGGESIDPEIGYLSAPLDLDKAGAYIDAEIDKVLQAAGVPRPLYYMESNALSGTAIYAEQQPIRDAARRKQEGVKLYETDLAEAILAVGAEIVVDQDKANAYRAAGLGGVNLTVAWEPQITTTEDTAQDLLDLEHGLQSIVDICRSRYGLSSDEEAVRKLMKVKRDRDLLVELGLIAGGMRGGYVEGVETPANTSEDANV
jgi:hypothetical protein